MSSLVVETSPVSWAWPYLQLYDHHANFNRKNTVSLPCLPMNSMLYRTKHVWLFTVYTIKIQNLNIKSGVFFLYKNLFFFVRLNRFLYIWVLKCKISACRFLNHYVLIRRFSVFMNVTASSILVLLQTRQSIRIRWTNCLH